MVLATEAALAKFAALLRCPRCQSELSVLDGGYRCTSAACEFSGGEGFPRIGEQPILIGGTQGAVSAASVKQAQGSSPIPRRAVGWIDHILQALRLTSAHRTRANCESFLSRLSNSAGHKPVVLVIGGGARGAGTEPLYEQRAHALLSFDIYASVDTQFVADAHEVPLRDGTVDGVWIQAVLEHVVEPARVVEEIHRVLRPGGIVYSEVPFMQHVHEAAYDFTRFTLSGHRYLYRRFDLIDAGVVGGPGTQLTWAIDYFVRSLTRSRLAGKLAKLAFVWLAWFDGLSSARHSVDAASGTYFLGRKAATTISHKDIVAFYSGAG